MVKVRWRLLIGFIFLVATLTAAASKVNLVERVADIRTNAPFADIWPNADTDIWPNLSDIWPNVDLGAIWPNAPVDSGTATGS
jgi:hypothetical protein